MILTTLEAILFAVAEPIAETKLRKNLEVSEEVLSEALDALESKFNVEDSGIHLLRHEGKVQFVTNKDVSDSVALFLKKEAQGPLTRPSLEALTIIAYRGPITKPEIEQIRGVNCSLILRNLLIRGFITEAKEHKSVQPSYVVSAQFVRALGLTRIEDLPEYSTFHDHGHIDEMLEKLSEEAPSV